MTENKQHEIERDEELEGEISSLLEEMNSDTEASADIDAIISIILEQGIVLNNKELENLIINVIKKSYKKSKTPTAKLTKSELLKTLKNLQSMSNFLLIQNILSTDTISKKKEGKDQHMFKAARDNLKLILKRSIIYEAYKIVNPRRIAGETLESNFKNNIIMRGVKNSLALEHKTYKQAEQTYGKGFIKQVLRDKKYKKSINR